eukprot:COSAG01_NODE_20637_length_943_cov_6.462085_2_plen_93_part_00
MGQLAGARARAAMHFSLRRPQAPRVTIGKCTRKPGQVKEKRYKICIHEIFCAGSFLPMALQVLVKEFVGYSALFLRTIEGKPTCPQYHKLDP